MELDWDNLTPGDLPGDLAELAHAHGMDVARYFLEEWGGMQIWIPSFKQFHAWDRIRPGALPRDMAEIARAVGMEVVKDILEHWGGLPLYITTKHSIYMDLVRERIASEFNGLNAGELARQYNIARRRIYEIVSPTKKEKREQQPGLF